MPRAPRLPAIKAKPQHPLQWLWDDLESDPDFTLRSMFGGRVAYFDGRQCLFFTAQEEPWSGVLVCMERENHAALIATIPALKPHPVLGKWLYLPDTHEDFERLAQAIVRLARQRDPRIGIISKKKPRKKSGLKD